MFSMLSLSVIALIVGALSIPMAFFALGGGGVFLSLLFAFGGLALGALGILRDPDKSGLALVGIACSALGLLIALICFAASGCAACQAAAAVL